MFNDKLLRAAKVVDANAGTLKLWNVRTGELLLTIEELSERFAVALSEDGRTLATGSVRKADDDVYAVKVWNVSDGKAR